MTLTTMHQRRGLEKEGSDGFLTMGDLPHLVSTPSGDNLPQLNDVHIYYGDSPLLMHIACCAAVATTGHSTRFSRAGEINTVVPSVVEVTPAPMLDLWMPMPIRHEEMKGAFLKERTVLELQDQHQTLIYDVQDAVWSNTINLNVRKVYYTRASHSDFLKLLEQDARGTAAQSHRAGTVEDM